MHEGRPGGHGGEGVEHCGQLLVVDLDQLGRGTRERRCGRRHRGDDVAGEARGRRQDVLILELAAVAAEARHVRTEQRDRVGREG